MRRASKQSGVMDANSFLGSVRILPVCFIEFYFGIFQTLEEVIRMLFAPNIDYAEIRKVVETRFEDVLSGNINIRELIFAKEYRGREGYRPNARVPALQIARSASFPSL